MGKVRLSTSTLAIVEADLQVRLKSPTSSAASGADLTINGFSSSIASIRPVTGMAVSRSRMFFPRRMASGQV
jgi:hypothetical protein